MGNVYIGSFPAGVSKRRPDGGTIPCCPFCGAPGKLHVYGRGFASVSLAQMLRHVDPSGGERS